MRDKMYVSDEHFHQDFGNRKTDNRESEVVPCQQTVHSTVRNCKKELQKQRTSKLNESTKVQFKQLMRSLEEINYCLINKHEEKTDTKELLENIIQFMLSLISYICNFFVISYKGFCIFFCGKQLSVNFIKLKYVTFLIKSINEYNLLKSIVSSPQSFKALSLSLASQYLQDT